MAHANHPSAKTPSSLCNNNNRVGEMTDPDTFPRACLLQLKVGRPACVLLQAAVAVGLTTDTDLKTDPHGYMRQFDLLQRERIARDGGVWIG